MLSFLLLPKSADNNNNNASTFSEKLPKQTVNQLSRNSLFSFYFLRDKRALNVFPLQDKKLRVRTEHLVDEHG